MSNDEEQRQLEKLMLKYSFALQRLETELDILLKEYEFNHHYNPVEHTKSRIKSRDSAFNKLRTKGYEVTVNNLIEHVHDMVGIRIVCSFLSDVYSIVDIIKNSQQFFIKEEKDYIKNPKDTGYISYHLLVLVPIFLNEKQEYVEAEIQIRTVAMDFWASLDHKLRYKIEDTISQDIKDEVFDCSMVIRKLDQKMQRVKDKMDDLKKNNIENK